MELITVGHLKKGTEIQNISRRQLDSSSKKANRIFGAYTESDKKRICRYDGEFSIRKSWL